MQMRDIRAKIKKYSAEIVTVVYVALGVGATIYLVKSANTNSENNPFEPFIEADGKTRYVKNTQHIVLENVQSNMWRDLDNPDDHYWLNGASEFEVHMATGA